MPFGKEEPRRLPTSLCSLFSTEKNPTSLFLKRFYKLLPEVADVGVPQACRDPFDYFLNSGSMKSARDRLRQAASARRRKALHAIAGDGSEFQQDLGEILIASTSFPIIHMSRSNPQNRRPNDLFIMSLKRKLHLEIYEPARCPTCICGQVIDPFGKHVFACTKVSKKRPHDSITYHTARVLQQLLVSVGIIDAG